MRNAGLLVVIVAAGVVNGLGLEQVPLWRQGLCLVLALVAFLHGRFLAVRRAWPVFAVAGAGGAGYAGWDTAAATGLLAMVTVFVALPWLAGRYLRQRAELIAVGRERIADLERERAYVAEGARLRERARIAADLHDALGHELALVALRAGALELDAAVPERQRDAAAELRKAAVDATDRLRQTLGMLRDADPEPDAPWDESLEGLVERVRAAGMTVSFSRTGAGEPAPLVDRALHRVTQEALTNAARHAPGAPVRVEVDRDRGGCTVTIANPVSGDVPPGDGSGLPGMRERVRLLGGTLDAGARDGVFTVTARIPEAGS